MRVFGSVAKGIDHEGSDVDLLVEMPLGTSLLHIVGLQLAIEDVLGVKVDLCTERELHPALRDRKTQSAVVRELAVIGEAVKNLSPALVADEPAVPWRAIAAHTQG